MERVCVCALMTYNLIKAHYHLMPHWYECVKEYLSIYMCVCTSVLAEVIFFFSSCVYIYTITANMWRHLDCSLHVTCKMSWHCVGQTASETPTLHTSMTADLGWPHPAMAATSTWESERATLNALFFHSSHLYLCLFFPPREQRSATLSLPGESVWNVCCWPHIEAIIAPPLCMIFTPPSSVVIQNSHRLKPLEYVGKVFAIKDCNYYIRK